MKRSTLSTAFYVLLVFLSGGVVGGFAHRLYMLNSVAATGPAASPKPDEWRRNYLDVMHKRLSLSDEQMTQLGSILDTTKARLDALRGKWQKEAREKARPEMKAIQEERLQNVNQILSDTQRVEYEKLRAEWNKEREKNRRPKTALPRGD